MQWLMIALISLVIVLSYHQGAALHYSWHFIDFNQINLILSIQCDPLAKIMMLFILVIGFFIYRYAQNYLESDQTRTRFLSQFILVLCSVLLLALSANLLTAFIAWQLIGINLYLLLNHYHYDPAANRAAKKKFIINRIGDCCFLLAIVLAYHSHSAATFSSIKTSTYATSICSLLAVSVLTKCAQFPFHIWLLDTMETPTPVSALMHAGVINAGGILLTRISSAFMNTPQLAYILLSMGLTSMLLSIMWMKRQPDTKKKLAYSTMGQMGYMLMQCSLGAFPAAIFHLMSHGFYKASLFLNAGETLVKPNIQDNAVTIRILIKSCLIALVIFFAGLMLFPNLQAPVLIYGFILLTLITLIVKTELLTHNTWHNKILHYGIVCIIYFAYLYVFQHITNLLSDYQYQSIISRSTQVCILLGVLILQLYLWLSKHTPTCFNSADKTEKFLRRLLLKPLRAMGDIINHKTYTGLSRLVYRILLIGLLYILASGVLHSMGHIKANHPVLLFTCLAIAIFALIIANRCLAIRSLIAYLILFQAAFINLAWLDGNLLIIKIGLFHLINISTVILALALLAKSKSQEKTPIISNNKLSARVFYLTCCLLLLIGIPGTASFVSEYYLLNALLSHGWILVIMYIATIILSATVIMHSLQLYVFNKKYTNLLATPISKRAHWILIATIGLNILCGLHPGLLLGLL